MDNLMIFDAKTKKKHGIINFIPATLFFLTLLYYIYLLFPLSQGRHELYMVVGITSENYDNLLIMLAVSAIVSAVVLVYDLVLLTRFRNMNSQDKLIWVLLLSTFVPIAFILFWVFIIKREPKYVGMYPDIV